MSTLQDLYQQAISQHRAGDLAGAERLYEQVLNCDEAHINALHLMGLVAHQTGRSDRAVEYIGRAVLLAPQFAEAHNNLGVTLAASGRAEEAVACYRRAIELKPDYAEAYNNLGIALAAQGEMFEAAAAYQEAIALAPDVPEVHNNLGLVWASEKKLADAVACYEQALRLRPGYADAHMNQGIALAAQGKLEAALAQYAEALRIHPADPKVHRNLGVAQLALGQPERASESFAHAVELNPAYAEAHYHLGMARLLVGDCARGWPEYEWRTQCPEFAIPRFPQPLWDGAPLDGRTILLHAEQGFGDTIQFVRYAPLVKARGARVVVACQEPLVRLLAQSPGIDDVSTGLPMPHFDVHVPLLSLPHVFGTTLDTIPVQVPYLRVAESQKAVWKDRLANHAGFKVGIVWQGNPRQTNEPHRSFPLAEYGPVARVPGVQLFSLQKGHGTDQIAALAHELGLIDLGPHLEDFLDTAAVISNLDLVISSDTSVAHLAGALGARTWVALAFAADWRWLEKRDDSPWYPTTRLFRQQEHGNWVAVFARIAAELERLMHREGTR